MADDWRLTRSSGYFPRLPRRCHDVCEWPPGLGFGAADRMRRNRRECPRRGDRERDNDAPRKTASCSTRAARPGEPSGSAALEVARRAPGRASQGRARGADAGPRRRRRRLDPMNGLIRQRNAVIAMGRSSVGGIDCHGSGQAWLAVPACGVRIAAECTLLVRPGHDGRVVGDAGEVGKATAAGAASLRQPSVIYVTSVWSWRSPADTPGRPRTPTDNNLRRHAHGHVFACRRGRLHSGSTASAEPAEGGGLAGQATGPYGAIGRDHTDPA